MSENTGISSKNSVKPSEAWALTSTRPIRKGLILYSNFSFKGRCINPRKVALSYLGWCPGIGAASRFVPDRDIPPRVMFAYGLALAALLASTYMVAYTGLTFIGFPSADTVNVNQLSPKLVAAGSKMYLAAEMEVWYRSDVVENRKIFLARMTVGGQVFNVNETLDTGGAYLATYDIIRTADEEWVTVFQVYTLAIIRDLAYIHSSDGIYWESPSTIFNDILTTRHIEDASLVETSDGDILLFYTKRVGPPATEYGEGYVMYMVRYSPQDGWSVPEQTPFKWMSVSSFRDIDGGVCVVGITYVRDDFRSNLARLLEDGSWSEPIDLNYTGSSKVDILYSENRNGYFLLGHGNLDNNYVQVCFSEDLKSLTISETFAYAQDPSLVELADGTLVIAYERVHSSRSDELSYSLPRTELYVSSSVDSVNWVTPHSVEGLVDEAGFNVVTSSRRFLASTLFSLIVTFILLFFLRHKHLF
jgi:hypothetical protein